MNLRAKKNFQYNTLFIILYFVFLLSFPFLRSYFNVNNIKVVAPESALVAARTSTNLVSGIFHNIVGYFSERKDLLNEISYLERELQEEKNKNVLAEVRDSNETKIVAKKIFSDFTNIYQAILLDKGRIDDVQEGAVVFLYPNKAIGVVDSVNNKSSLVFLFSKDKNLVEGVVNTKNSKENLKSASTGNESAENLDLNSTTSTLSVTTSGQTLTFPNEINIDLGTPISSSGGLLIEFIGYGSGDFVAKIPENINISTGTIVYLARDENKALGEIIKIEKQEASFHQILFVRGYYNTRENGDYYIENN
jgi:cell shape-determining protein MreC